MASVPQARASRSTFSPQVTLYTPPSPTIDSKPDTSTWVRRSSRSSTAPKPDTDPTPAPEPPKVTRSRHFKRGLKAEAGADDRAGEVKGEEVDEKPKPAKVAKAKVFKRYLEVAHPAPKRWREAFEIIREQRKE